MGLSGPFETLRTCWGHSSQMAAARRFHHSQNGCCEQYNHLRSIHLPELLPATASLLLLSIHAWTCRTSYKDYQILVAIIQNITRGKQRVSVFCIILLSSSGFLDLCTITYKHLAVASQAFENSLGIKVITGK